MRSPSQGRGPRTTRACRILKGIFIFIFILFAFSWIKWALEGVYREIIDDIFAIILLYLFWISVQRYCEEKG